MSIAVRVTGGVAKFLYGYIVGDDLLAAVVVVLGLGATAGLIRSGIPAWWLTPLLVVVITGIYVRQHAHD